MRIRRPLVVGVGLASPPAHHLVLTCRELRLGQACRVASAASAEASGCCGCFPFKVEMKEEERDDEQEVGEEMEHQVFSCYCC